MRGVVISILILPFIASAAIADCSSDWRDLNDCLRAAAEDHQACLRRWSENPDPQKNIRPERCAEQRSNDEEFCRQACSSSIPNATQFGLNIQRSPIHSLKRLTKIKVSSR